MANQGQTQRRPLLHAAGVIVTSLSCAGLLLAAYLAATGGLRAAGHGVDAVTRAEVCRGYFELLGDRTPRRPASQAERRATERMMVQNARECTIRDDGKPLLEPDPSPTPETGAEPQPGTE